MEMEWEGNVVVNSRKIVYFSFACSGGSSAGSSFSRIPLRVSVTSQNAMWSVSNFSPSSSFIAELFRFRCSSFRTRKPPAGQRACTLPCLRLLLVSDPACATLSSIDIHTFPLSSTFYPVTPLPNPARPGLLAQEQTARTPEDDRRSQAMAVNVGCSDVRSLTARITSEEADTLCEGASKALLWVGSSGTIGRRRGVMGLTIISAAAIAIAASSYATHTTFASVRVRLASRSRSTLGDRRWLCTRDRF